MDKNLKVLKEVAGKNLHLGNSNLYRAIYGVLHSVGIVDSDYYGNSDNDGHIMFAFYNIKDVDVEIKKGDAIGQGIFQKFLAVDNDNAEGERMGGFGSTNK